MKRQISLAAWAAAGVVLASVPVAGAPVGSDAFDYSDGPVAGNTGCTGWNVERTNEAAAGPSSASDWDPTAAGTANVVGGTLVTSGGGAKREYNGPTEGSAAGTNEREGAFRGAGSVFFGVDMTRQAGADWSGVSSFDFGTERVFFGVPSGQTFFGLQESAAARTVSTIQAEAGRTYRVVAELNFDTDRINLWVDPEAGDQLTPDATRAYTATNWSTAVRLASGGTGSTTWDNLVVATDWNDPGLVPEPGSLALLGVGALGLLRRRR